MTMQPRRNTGLAFRRGGAGYGITATLAVMTSSACYAQVTTTYSYNSSNRVIQAISSTGTGVQYQYDAAGNTVAVSAISAQALTQGMPDSVTFSTAGEAALLSLTITVGQPVVLTESALMTAPSGAAVIVNVYNSAGSLVASFNTTSSSSVDLSSLAAGTYSVVVVPASGATGSVQLALNTEGVAASDAATDGPMPIWALVVLGSGLVGIGVRAQQRPFS